MDSQLPSRLKWIVAIGAVAAAAILAQRASDAASADVTGIVFDVTTSQPVEGAYVMAVYKKAGSQLFAHSASWCVKTKGMYTGKNGVFRFPAEDSHQPQVYVIKPDFAHALNGVDMQHVAVLERQWDGSERVKPDPNIYLKPQDPAAPRHVDGDHCERAETREDVEANIVFAKLHHAEMNKYFPGRQSEESFQRAISMLESLPPRAAPARRSP